jgi:hypothetical protein
MMHLLAAVFLAAVQSPQADSVVYVFSPASRLEVQTGKSGLFGFAGHEHLIRARAFTGRIVYHRATPEQSRVEIVITTDSLEVLTPPDTEEIQGDHDMRSKVPTWRTILRSARIAQHHGAGKVHLVALTIRNERARSPGRASHLTATRSGRPRRSRLADRI